MGKFTDKSKEMLAKQIFAGAPDFEGDPMSALAQTMINNIKEAIEQKDITQYTKRGRWYNLPFGLDGELIERIMYYKGRGALFYVKTVDKFYFLPFCLDGSIDCEGGRYLDIRPLIFGGSDDNKEDKSFIEGYKLSPIYQTLIPEQVTKEVIENGCVILNDRTQKRTQYIKPMFMLQEPYIDMETNICVLLRTAIMNKVGMKGIKANSPDDGSKILQASKSKWLYALAGYTYLPIETSLNSLESLDDTNTNIQEMFMALQSWDNMRLDNLGIQNGGVFEKQGTVLQTEAMYGVAPTEIVEDDYVYQRQKFCNIVNSIYGTKVWYEPISQMNMDEPVQDQANDSTATMYENELSQSSGSNTTETKEGE